MKLSEALQLVVDDLCEQDPDRYGTDFLGAAGELDEFRAVEIYREWSNDGATVGEIDEAERGRQLDAELADAYRVVLTAGYGPVTTVLLGTQEQADAVDAWIDQHGTDTHHPIHLVNAS